MVNFGNPTIIIFFFQNSVSRGEVTVDAIVRRNINLICSSASSILLVYGFCKKAIMCVLKCMLRVNGIHNLCILCECLLLHKTSKTKNILFDLSISCVWTNCIITNALFEFCRKYFEECQSFVSWTSEVVYNDKYNNFDTYHLEQTTPNPTLNPMRIIKHIIKMYMFVI